MRRLASVLAACLLAAPAFAQMRMKDIARIGGGRDMELVGYGLVIGLRGTGDRPGTNPSAQSLVNMLNRLGVAVSAQEIASSNVAAVAVTVRVPSFTRAGAVMDARVSSIGSAVSLENGTLLLTPLLGADGRSYATAQGALAAEPESAPTGKAASARATTASVPGGVYMESSLPTAELAPEGLLTLRLNNPDFVTAERIAQSLRETFHTEARALDPARVEVTVPNEFREDPVAFAARVEMASVGADEAPRVVVNSLTGTVVAGRNVKITPVTIAHSGLKVEVGTEGASYSAEGSVSTLVTLLNGVGARPRDVAVIFRMLKRLGALKADLEIL